MFDMEKYISDGETSDYNLVPISELCQDGRGRVISNDYITRNSGVYPVYSSQTSNDGIMGYIDTFDFDGEYITWTTDGAKAGTIFYRNGKFNCTNVCGTLKVVSEKVNVKYLTYILGKIAHLYVNHVGNDKLMNVEMRKINIPIPAIELQNEFAIYVNSIDKLRFASEQKKKELLEQKKALFDKYFR